MKQCKALLPDNHLSGRPANDGKSVSNATLSRAPVYVACFRKELLQKTANSGRSAGTH